MDSRATHTPIAFALNGQVVVTLIIDEDGEPLGDPWCEIRGIAEIGSSGAPLVDVLEEDLSQFVGRAGAKTMRDDAKLEEELRRIVRKTAQDEIGHKPEVTVVVSRLSSSSQTDQTADPGRDDPFFATEGRMPWTHAR